MKLNFFLNGAAPASASIDAYSLFYYFIKEFYKLLQFIITKGLYMNQANKNS
jgi:hypothetical protein